MLYGSFRLNFAGREATSMSASIVLKIMLLLVLFLAASPPHAVRAASASPAAGTAYLKQKVLGVWAHIIVVDLNEPSLEVGVELARGGIHTSETFGSMVNRTHPVAAITGTFFCTRSLVPVGDVMIDGRLVNQGPVGACLAYTADRTVRIRAGDRGVSPDWTGSIAGVRSGPQLISGGRISINARREGFRDRGLFGRRTRAAVGVTSHNKLLLVAVKRPVTFTELAKVMRALGATEAVNLDGGSSTALSYGSRILVRPGRRLTNLIVVSKRRSLIASPVKALPALTSEPSPQPVVLAASPAPSPDHGDVLTNLPDQQAVLPEQITGRIIQ
jgi:hypothetical protein